MLRILGSSAHPSCAENDRSRGLASFNRTTVLGWRFTTLSSLAGRIAGSVAASAAGPPPRP
ncbi:hypothetical protein SBRY_40160 [Actinacidiphila bryophytorum]|uniref:Uncharacterized protein n=1 Tax=Actinacidiphila bryophytorum TaxID=1436133 RepID=A0A9W4MHV6_9ACTN|nr:hypothetical protein SBRY_40160 [Actinacidiphila bryophytorum]